MTIAASPAPAAPIIDSLRERLGAGAVSWWPALLAALLVLGARAVSKQNVDISWVLTLGERMLEGQRLYIDLIELNPPAAVWFYMPAIVIGRLFGMRPELVVELQVLAEIAGCVWFTLHVLRGARLMPSAMLPWFAAALLLVLGVLPARTFGEREHIGFIALLPLLAVLSARAAAAPLPGFGPRLLAGLLAGLAVVTKPHFAATLPLLAGLLLWQRRRPARSLGTVLAELLAAEWLAVAAVAVAYAVTIRILYPAYFAEIVPLVVAVYLPVRVSPVAYLVPGVLMAVAAGTLLHLTRSDTTGSRQQTGPRALRHPLSPWLLAACLGGIVSVLLQGKGWPYHTYPAVAPLMLMLLAETLARVVRLETTGAGLATRTVASLTDGAAPRLLRIVAAALLPWVWFDIDEERNRSEIARLIAETHTRPTLFLVSADVSMAHPLVRDIGGRFTQTVGSNWIASGVMQELARPGLTTQQRAQMEAYGRMERSLLLSDLRWHKPDIILFGRPAKAAAVDWLAWANQDADIARELKAYAPSGIVGDVAIWHRRKDIADR